MIKLHEGDARQVLRTIHRSGKRFHACVTDPPYGLVSIIDRFGSTSAAPAKPGRDGAFARQSRGFMGKRWDGTGIERDPAFWRLVFDVLLPGAYIVAFSHSRTYHHVAIAIERAGFVTHPLIGWAYGSGMPRPHSAAQHVERWAPGRGNEFKGMVFGAGARKLALEPIYIGQKPFSEKNAALNLLRHGVGAVRIDGCRVKANGNWPANLIHDGSDEVKTLFPGESAGFFESYHFLCEDCGDTGYVVAGDGTHGNMWQEGCPTCLGACLDGTPFDREPIIYNAKAGKADRAGSSHPTVKPIALMQALIRHVTPRSGHVLDPFAGSGTTGQAARNEGVDCTLIEQDRESIADIRRRLDLPKWRGPGLNELFGEPSTDLSTLQRCYKKDIAEL